METDMETAWRRRGDSRELGDGLDTCRIRGPDF